MTNLEVVCCLLVVLHGPVEVRDVILVDLGNVLVVLGSHGKAAHVRVDVHGLNEAVGGLCKEPQW